MKSSKYISTRGQVAPIDFSQAVMMGLAEDGGLLLPMEIPNCQDKLDKWKNLSYQELAFEIMRLYCAGSLSEEDLQELIKESYSTFDSKEIVPLKKLSAELYLAELFHGPTLAFKDVALQFLGNLFAYLLKKNSGKLNIVGATSGDTGSAAIYGLKGKENINIFILYPEGRVSPIQEMQMASVPDVNVHCLAIEGTFDDGQRIVKEIFNDLDFKQKYSLGAVNSVNWARILAQVVYYFWSAFRVQELQGAKTEVQFSVPTGNFGDIFAGYVAMKMGAPIKRLILATNENDILSRFFNSGEYSLGSVQATLSPSMDIQVASNFERYLYYRCDENAKTLNKLMEEFAVNGKIILEGNDEDFAAAKVNTEETLQTIKKYKEKINYILDPHSAVGVKAAEKNTLPKLPCICLATAHPGKFHEAIEKALGSNSEAKHPKLEELKGKKLRKTIIPANVNEVKRVIVASG